METNKSSLRYKPKHDFNPLKGTDRLTISNDQELIKYDKEGNVAVIKQNKQDDVHKLYCEFIAKELGLSARARAVLYYIVSEDKKSVDKVRIDMERLKEVTGYNSFAPIYFGINQLIEKQLIARTFYIDQFFINPNFITPNMKSIGIFTVLDNSIYTKAEVKVKVESGVEDTDLPDGFDMGELSEY